MRFGKVKGGAKVDEVPLYDTRAEPAAPEQLDRALAADYVTFTASSTVRSFVGLLGDDPAARLAHPRVVSIGPITSATVRDAGLTVHAEADRYDIPGLLDALLRDVGVSG